jgi:ABC-2 type transport system permease protein
MIRPIKAIIIRNLIKLGRDRMRLILSFFMSGLFLFVFSFVTKSMVSGFSNPMNYLISGVIIMTVFQAAMNNSMNILDDIANGFMKEILVAPIARWQIAIGHIVSSMIVSVIQALLIIIIGLFMGLSLDLTHGILMIGLMCLVGLTFSSLGLYLATLAKDSTNFQLLIAVTSFPLTFLSGAYIPTMAIPNILLPVVYLNPLTYTTSSFRYISLQMENLSTDMLLKSGVAFNISGFIITPFISTILIFIMCTAFFALCVQRFNKADFSRIKVFKHRH